MILSSREISDLGLVHNRMSAGERETTYDATVGEIIHEGETYRADAYVLPSRGMVWVVSHERFALPNNLTGLATLRTTWTHNGILALNVGIVDPGWDGPLATALVNFSNTNFEIRRGEAFLRVVFLQHLPTVPTVRAVQTNTYLRQIRERSARIPNTFLNLSSLAEEMQSKMYGSPIFGSWIARIGAWVAAITLVVVLVSIFVPIAYGVSTEWISRKADLEVLKHSVDSLQKQQDEFGARLK
jgi:deoxycytidine triphosphate deaminase